MRLDSQAGRSICVCLLTSFLLSIFIPLGVSAQTAQPSVPAQTAQQAVSDPIQAIMDKADESYRLGLEALSKGDAELSRRMFDQAVDAVLMSGINLRANAKLDRYYRDLLDRIHKHEAQPDDIHVVEQRPETVEPSVLDELSTIQDSELAAATTDGMKVYGKFDFEFSVAPPVFQFINYFTEGRGRSTMEAGLQRSGRYRQMVEKIFKEERVPQDLMWLAQAESVWKPRALSRAAAKGIWQFVPSTGTQYGLNQTTWVDDRSHPEKATRAAARYLRFLHDHFAGDWLLAMAAYNSGENRVDSTVARCGYADFWEMYKRGLLPLETRNYVPIILAITIISKNQKRYGFDIKTDPTLNYDIYEVPGQTDLKVVAELLGAPYETVEEMNPELRRGTSPPGQTYPIRLPKGTRKQFEIAYAALPEEKRVRKIVIPRDDIADGYRPSYRTQVASYQVRKGDTLASLARRNKVSVKEIARLNRMSARDELRKGQTVKIPKQVRASTRDRHGRYRANRYREEPAVRSQRRGRSRSRAGSSKGRTASHASSRRHRR